MKNHVIVGKNWIRISIGLKGKFIKVHEIN